MGPYDVERIQGLYETGFILLFLVSVYKVPFSSANIGKCINIGCPLGDTRNINPASYSKGPT